MNLVMPLVVGGLVAAGLYMMMRRSLIRLVIGLSLLRYAENLLIFTAGGLERAHSPLIQETEEVLRAPYPDPLPQALILTAIVIGFGLQAFAIALIFRVYCETGSDDLDDLTVTEE